MPGDGRVVRVGQPELAQADGATTLRPRRPGDLGERIPSRQSRATSSRSRSNRAARPMRRDPRPRTLTRTLSRAPPSPGGAPWRGGTRGPARCAGARSGCQASFRRPWRRAPGPCCLRRAGCDRPPRRARARGCRRRRRRPRNDRGVCRAAAHVADQHRVAEVQAPAPLFAHGREPGVERRLRLLEQDDVLQAGQMGGGDRELARRRVERGGDGDEHLLLFERRVQVRVVSRPRAGAPGTAKKALGRRDLSRSGVGPPRRPARPPRRRSPRRARAGWRRGDRRRRATATTSRTTPAGAGDPQPRSHAIVPTTWPGSASQGTLIASAGTSTGVGSNRNDGSVVRASTSPALVTCGTEKGEIAEAMATPAPSRRSCRRKPARSWWCRHRFRRRSGPWCLSLRDQGCSLKGPEPRRAPSTWRSMPALSDGNRTSTARQPWWTSVP